RSGPEITNGACQEPSARRIAVSTTRPPRSPSVGYSCTHAAVTSSCESATSWRLPSSSLTGSLRRRSVAKNGLGVELTNTGASQPLPAGRNELSITRFPPLLARHRAVALPALSSATCGSPTFVALASVIGPCQLPPARRIAALTLFLLFTINSQGPPEGGVGN